MNNYENGEQRRLIIKPRPKPCVDIDNMNDSFLGGTTNTFVNDEKQDSKSQWEKPSQTHKQSG